MQALTESRFSLRDMYRILFRYKTRSAIVFLATIALVIAGIIVAPRQYASEARLFVKTGRESVALDPTATTGQTLQVYESRENEIQSLLDVLHSRVLYEKVVDRLGPQTILRGDEEESAPSVIGVVLGGVKPILAAMGLADQVDDREKAVQQLQKCLGVESTKKSAVVVVRCKADSPQLAQKILDTYVDSYYTLHHRVHRTAGSHEFFAEQAELLKTQLDQATGELRDLKNQVGVVSVEGQREILEEHITSLDRELLVTEAALHSAQQRIKVLRRAQGNVEASSGEEAASALTNTAIDEMRDQLFSLQIRERELAAMYHDKHPRLIALRDQVQAAQSVLDEQELMIEQSQAASLQAKVDNLQAKYATARQTLRQLNENEVRIRELERRQDMLQENYRTYAKNLELTRMNESLEKQRISNVNLVQPATLVEKPVSPKKVPILALGVLLATLGAVGTALACEHLDHSLKTPEEVEQQLDLPVLLSIPRLANGQVARYL